jgi:hypothetical protein
MTPLYDAPKAHLPRAEPASFANAPIDDRGTRRGPGEWALRALPAPRDDTAAQSWNGSPGDRYKVGGGRMTHPPASAASPVRPALAAAGDGAVAPAPRGVIGTDPAGPLACPLQLTAGVCRPRMPLSRAGAARAPGDSCALCLGLQRGCGVRDFREGIETSPSFEARSAPSPYPTSITVGGLQGSHSDGEQAPARAITFLARETTSPPTTGDDYEPGIVTHPGPGRPPSGRARGTAIMRIVLSLAMVSILSTLVWSCSRASQPHTTSRTTVASLRPGKFSAERRGIGLSASLMRENGSIKPWRSLVVTDVDIVKRFSFEEVMTLLAGQAGDGVTALSLFRQWWDTQNIGGGAEDGCRPETELFHFTFPYCAREEGRLITDDPFADGPTGFMAIGLFNRIDLAAQDGSDCGEYRIVFARKSGESHANERLLINFEAVLPSPTGTRAGCKPVAEFWRSLSDLDDPGIRADQLRRFYFEKDFLPNFPNVVHIDNYGARVCTDEKKPCPTGQIRTNQFMMAPWVMGEFTIVRDPTRRPAVRIRPEPVADTPFASLMCCQGPFVTGAMMARFHEEFLRAVPALATSNPLLARYQPGLAPDLNAARAINSPGGETDYLAALEASPDAIDVRAAIAAKLPVGSPLSPNDIVARAQGLSCSGCHRLNNDLAQRHPDTRFSPLWPSSLGFEHVSERAPEPNPEGRLAYRTSPALNAFLKLREVALCGLSEC